MGEGVLVWDLRWIRGLLVWKKELVANLITVFNRVTLASDENIWSWKLTTMVYLQKIDFFQLLFREMMTEHKNIDTNTTLRTIL